MAALGAFFFFSLFGAFGGDFGQGKKYSETRIVIENIFRPFRIHWGAGWGGLHREPLDDVFYK
jgi:hypothetical protein